MKTIWLNHSYFQEQLTNTAYTALREAAGKACAGLMQGRLHPARETGWLQSNRYTPMLADMERVAADIRSKSDVVVLVGVGGSNQAARAVIKALRPQGGPEICYAGNTLSALELHRLLGTIKDKHVSIIVIAKNFATLEPGSHFRVLRHALEQRYGKAGAASRTVVIGTQGQRLWEMAQAEGYTFFPFPEDVGGRYSALTPVGLLPMLVAGVDCRRLLQGAAAMEAKLREEPAANMAVEYAALRNAALEKGCIIEVMAVFEPVLAWFSRWWVQLFGESEGQDGKGIYPSAAVYSEDLHAMGQYMQEGRRILQETFLCVQEPPARVLVPPNTAMDDEFAYLDGWDFCDINRVAYEGTIAAHAKGGVPCMELGLPDFSEEIFGQLFYFFMVACVLSAHLQGINPFGQNGVEEYKRRMMEGLGNG